ncbi:class I tRNA ligase family protein [Bacillus sp. WP8]|uniref:class I tRNA ligase family protein n=1 Tax=Bacillus sp. WP8 TaxID=756828 RepID=UPI0021B6A827|nr:class I tRNA ligase family protein [Bacillus sp. WP8]
MEEEWGEKEMYQMVLEGRKGGGRFILDDGGGYGNGEIDMGHGVNKMVKDFMVRFK